MAAEASEAVSDDAVSCSTKGMYTLRSDGICVPPSAKRAGGANDNNDNM